MIEGRDPAAPNHRAGEQRRLPVRPQPRRHDPPEAVRRAVVRSHGAQGRSDRHRDHVQPARLGAGAAEHHRAGGDAAGSICSAATARSCGAVLLDNRRGRFVAVAREGDAARHGRRGDDVPASPRRRWRKPATGRRWRYRAGAEFIDMEMMQFHPDRPAGGQVDRHRRAARRRPARRGRAALQRPGRALHGEVLAGQARARDARRRQPLELHGNHGRAGHAQRRRADRRDAPRREVPARQLPRHGAIAAANTGSTCCTRASRSRPAPTTTWAACGSIATCRCNVEGLFVAGEDAGGVHGANRLGGNGVADSIVFGAARATRWRSTSRQPRAPTVPESQVQRALRHAGWRRWSGQAARTRSQLRERLEEVMWLKVGVVRNGPDLRAAVDDLQESASAQAAAADGSGGAIYNAKWNEVHQPRQTDRRRRDDRDAAR